MEDQSNRIARWGIMGAGIIASKMAEALQKSSEATLVAVGSKSPERAQSFADRFQIAKAISYEQLVADDEIDVIYVATTHNFHFENAKLALEKGKHVLIEKPFTVNAAQAEALIEIAKSKGLFLMEAMWTRFLPAVQKLRSNLLDGLIGEVKSVNLSFGGFVSPRYEKRLTDPNLAGGVTLDMGVYPISFITYILGNLPEKVLSMTRFSDKGVDEVAHYMFQFHSGCLVNISTSYNLWMRNDALIYGAKGYILIPEFMRADRYNIHLHNGTNAIEKSEETLVPTDENGFSYQISEVVACIRAGKIESPVMPLAETYSIMKLMDEMRGKWGLRYPFE